MISMEGFLILNCIGGGQALASVSNRLDDTAGIVIISVLSLIVSSISSGLSTTSMKSSRRYHSWDTKLSTGELILMCISVFNLQASTGTKPLLGFPT